jgi:TP901 family phage tail tape measure protein
MNATNEYPWAIEELAAAIAIFSHANVRSNRAGPALRDAMRSLQRPSQLTRETIDRLGLDTKDGDGNLLPLSEIVEQLSRAEPAHEDFWKLFGIQAGSTMSQLVRYGPQTLRNLAEQVPLSEYAETLLEDTRELIGPL